MRVRFLKYLATSTASYRMGDEYDLPDAVAGRYKGAGLCEELPAQGEAGESIAPAGDIDPNSDEEDATLPIEDEAVPVDVETHMRRQPETTARRRRK